MSEHPTINQTVIVCPHCGHCADDSRWWGHGFEDEQGADDCDKCGKEIFWTRETSVTYSTEKPTKAL